MRRYVLHANKNGAGLGIRCEPCFHLGLYRVEVSKTKWGGGGLCAQSLKIMNRLPAWERNVTKKDVKPFFFKGNCQKNLKASKYKLK